MGWEDRDMKKIELRLYEHPETRAKAYDAAGFAIEEEVAAYGWDYTEGDTIQVGGDLYTITQIYDDLQTGDVRGNFRFAVARK